MEQTTLNHEYYYGNEAEQYTFYRLPKVLFTDIKYRNLSDGAKILYGLMLDRMALSIKNGWTDKENRVYIYFTLENLQEYMSCGHNKGVKIMSELNNIGLIERVKRGQGKPAIIFVKKFLSSDNDALSNRTDLLNHEYYYGGEAEQYTFYRLPKALFTNSRYKNLSDGAKILYGLMLDRMGLSVKNGWLNKENKVYIYFTLEDSQEYMGCGHNKSVKIMSELDNIDLIERIKQGQGKPTIIFVKKFFSGDNDFYRKQTDSSIKTEQDLSDESLRTSDYRKSILPKNRNQDLREAELQTSDYGKSTFMKIGNQDFSKQEMQTSENGKYRLPISRSADIPISDANNTYITNNDFNKTNGNNINHIQSYQPSEVSLISKSRFDMIDEIREREDYREFIKDNIEYKALCRDYEKERVDEILELMTDVVCSKRDYIRVSQDDYPKEVVKSRLLKINQFHIEYFFDCFDKNTTKVHNIGAYLLTCLFKAPTTMSSYYRQMVNHDLYRPKG